MMHKSNHIYKIIISKADKVHILLKVNENEIKVIFK